MITCLDNLIGVRDLATYNQPDTGFFINDLPGITTQKLEDIGDQEDHYEPRLAWEDILDRASRKFEDDVKTRMMPYFKNYSYKGHSITGQIDVDNITLATEAFYSGWWFDLANMDENLSLVLETANIHIVSGSNFEIKVFDAITGETLNTIGYAATLGLNEYRILVKLPLWKYRKIFVGYDANAISVKQVDRFDRNLGTVSANHVSKTASVTEGNITSSNTGLMLTYNVECSVDNFICQRIDLFKNPILYKHGIEFCNEQIYSDRINRWTLLNVEEAKDLKENLLVPEYEQMMDNIFRDIRVRDRGECFECAKPVTYKTFLP